MFEILKDFFPASDFALDNRYRALVIDDSSTGSATYVLRATDSIEAIMEAHGRHRKSFPGARITAVGVRGYCRVSGCPCENSLVISWATRRPINPEFN